MSIAQSHTAPPLIKKKLKRTIQIWVIAGHIILIALFIIMPFVSNFLKPKKIKLKTITVQLVQLPANAPQRHPKAQPTKKSSPPPPIKKDNPKKKIKKKPIKKKVIKKKPVKRKKKVVKKKPIKKKKRWKAKKVTDIKITRIKPKRPIYTPKINIANELNKALSHIKVKHSKVRTSRSGRSTPPSKQVLNYFDTVASQLYQLWEQPSDIALKGRRPSVDIYIRFSTSGRILSSKIIKKSNITVMDRSVRDLLKSLSTIPRPPAGVQELTVKLVVQ